MRFLLMGMFSLCLSATACAADIRVYLNNFIVVEGQIVKGDYDRLESMVKGLGGRGRVQVLLATPGGDFFEGIEI